MDKTLSRTCRALLLGTALVLPSCGTGGNGDEPSEGQAIVVPVVKATRRSVSERIDLTGELRPYQQIDLRARVSGYVEEMKVDVGDRVRQGQLISTLTVPESKSELEEARAARRRSERAAMQSRGDVERAQSELDAARLIHSRLAGIFQSNPNLIARQEIDTALTAVRVSEAQLDSARAGLAVAEEQVRVQAANEARARAVVNYSTVTAPIAGLITMRYADRGTMIQGGDSQGQAIVQLSQIDPLRLVLPLPESIAPDIAVGRVVQVEIPVLQRAFTSRVARLSGILDETTRTMEAEMDVENADMLLKPGMHARVAFELAARPSALTVPVQALSRAGGKTSVMVVNSHKRIELREVVIGIETPSDVEVASGLSDGELVVVGSQSLLEPGELVTPRDTQPVDAAEEDF